MSFAALLVHSLAIVEPVYEATDDDYGQPEADDPAVSLVQGMVQPKTAREMALTSQAGAELSDHTIFLLPRRIAAGAWIGDADTDGVLAGGRRFDITGIRSIEFGSVPHLEVDAHLVGSTEGPTVGS
jgi:hypothetical protein